MIKKETVDCKESRENGNEATVHFHVMQSLRHNKWVLAAVKGNFEEYQATDVMSSNVELMVQYADYLNKRKTVTGLDGKQIAMLEQLKERYSG